MVTISLTQTEFNRHASLVSVQTGCAITSNKGSISHFGVTVAYSYDAPSGRLALDVTQKPFFLSTAMVETRLRDWFGA